MLKPWSVWSMPIPLATKGNRACLEKEYLHLFIIKPINQSKKDSIKPCHNPAFQGLTFTMAKDFSSVGNCQIP